MLSYQFLKNKNLKILRNNKGVAENPFKKRVCSNLMRRTVKNCCPKILTRKKNDFKGNFHSVPYEALISRD